MLISHGLTCLRPGIFLSTFASRIKLSSALNADYFDRARSRRYELQNRKRQSSKMIFDMM